MTSYMRRAGTSSARDSAILKYAVPYSDLLQESGKALSFGFFFRKSGAPAGLVNMTLRFGKLCTFYFSEPYCLKVLCPSCFFLVFLSLFIVNQHDFRFHHCWIF